MKRVFRAHTLIPCDPHRNLISDAFIAVEKDRIVDVGPWRKRPRSQSFHLVDCSWGLIIPGLFNLHTHLPMVLMRGIAEDVGLKPWLEETIFPIEQKWVSPSFVRDGAELAICESLRGGVSFLGDMYFYEEETARIATQYGVRAILAQSYFDEGSPDCRSIEEAFNKIRTLKKRYEGNSSLEFALGPHAPYSCSPLTLAQTVEAARELDIGVMIHVSETKSELENIKEKWAKTPVKYIMDAGLLNSKWVLMAHMVWLETEDFSRVNQPHLSSVLNPQCNAKLGSGIAPVNQMKEVGHRFCLGTDGAASNNNLDILSEMNFLSKIHRLNSEDLTSLSGIEILEAATIRAAESVGHDQELGSLEPGKQADFAIIDLRHLHFNPITHPLNHLIHSARARDVHSLYIGGRCVLKDGKLRVGNADKACQKANRWWKRMRKTT